MRLYLCLDVVKRRRANDGKADEEDIGLGVGKRSQPVVILLSSSIPQSQAYWLPVHHDICRVVIEAGRALARALLWQGSDKTYTVGMYSPGKALVVYEMRRHV